MLAEKLAREWDRVAGRPYDREDPRANYPYVIVCRNGGPRHERGSGLGCWVKDLEYVIEEWEGTAMGRDGDFTVMSSEDQAAIFDYCFDWNGWEQKNSLVCAMENWMEHTDEGRTWKDVNSHRLAERDIYNPDPVLVAEARRRFLPAGWTTEEGRRWEMVLALMEEHVEADEEVVVE